MQKTLTPKDETQLMRAVAAVSGSSPENRYREIDENAVNAAASKLVVIKFLKFLRTIVTLSIDNMDLYTSTTRNYCTGSTAMIHNWRFMMLV